MWFADPWVVCVDGLFGGEGWGFGEVLGVGVGFGDLLEQEEWMEL